MARREDVAQLALVSEDDVTPVPLEQLRSALATRLDPGVLAAISASSDHCTHWRVGGSYYWDDPEWGPVVNVGDLRYDEERGLALDTQAQERRLYGLRLRKRRLWLNLSQSALAKTLGVSIDAVQDWEQGRRLPRLRKLIEQAFDRLEAEANAPTGYVQGVPMYGRPNLPTPERFGGEPLHPNPA